MVKVNLTKQDINIELELNFHINLKNVKIKKISLIYNNLIRLQAEKQFVVHIQKIEPN